MKKPVAMILILCMLISGTNVFAHWANESVEYCIGNDFTVSDSILVSELDTPILRGEVANLVSKAMSDNIKVEDIVKGDESGNLWLERKITREEFFTVIGRAFDFSSEDFDVLDRFADVDNVSDYAKPFISGLIEENLVRGYSNNEIMPKADITNAEAMTVIERVHKYVTKTTATPEPVQTATPSPTPSSTPISSGGSRPRPTQTPDTIPPKIMFSLSNEDLTWEPVTISVNATDNVGLKDVRWIKAASGGNALTITYIPYNVNYKLLVLYCVLMDEKELYNSIEEYEGALNAYNECVKYQIEQGMDKDFANLNGIMNYYSNVYSEPLNEENSSFDWSDWLEWIEHPEEFKDFSEPIVDGKITTKQNGVFYIYAEDMQGNKTIQEIFIPSIRKAQAELEFTKYETPIDDIIASIKVISITENPNAPIVDTWLVSKSLHGGLGGGFVDENVILAGQLNIFQQEGMIIPETAGEYLIKDLGQHGSFSFVMLDEWGNYSFSTVNAQ